MAPPVYSERFLYGRSTGTTQTLIIPPGRRAVVRFASIVTFYGAAEYVVLRVAGLPVIWLQTPTQDVTKHWDLRCVAYAGDLLELLTAGGDVAWHVSGFLFSDG